MIYIVIALLLLLLALGLLVLHIYKKNNALTLKIERLKQQNKEAISKKTKFLATASHDLQQPHQALGLFLASINDETLDIENIRIINKAKDAHETTSRLLNQLLDISKLDTMQKPELKLVPLHELVHSIGMKFMPVAACYGVELRIRQREAYAMTDAVMLERMLTNILLNAFRHAKKANILLNIRKKTVKHRPHWIIEVYDTGLGISEDKKDLIFQEFTKLGKPSSSPSGLGLGLAIVKRLSDLLSAPVGVKSRLGKGSCFYIQLKAYEQYINTPHTEVIVEDSVIRERLKVVVINDNRLLRDSLETLLLSWGCLPKSFTSSSKAKQAIEEQAWKPDALIIDGTLRHTHINIEDLQDIQANSGQDMPMILITKDINSIFAKEAQRLGFALLADPIDAKILRELLGNH